MIKTKILVLLVSLITLGLYFVGKHAVGLGLCDENDYSCRSSYDSFEGIMYFSKALVFVAVCSLFLKRTYYSAWWRFARFALPISIIFLILINTGVFRGQAAGSFGMGDIYNMLFDQLYAFTVNSLFVLGSIITIFIAWRKSKKSNAKSK